MTWMISAQYATLPVSAPELVLFILNFILLHKILCCRANFSIFVIIIIVVNFSMPRHNNRHRIAKTNPNTSISLHRVISQRVRQVREWINRIYFINGAIIFRKYILFANWSTTIQPIDRKFPGFREGSEDVTALKLLSNDYIIATNKAK